MPESANVVLNVHATETTRQAVSDLIRSNDLIPQEAGSCVAACRQLAQDRPDLIVLDAQLPEAQTLCRAIQNEWDSASVPILVWAASREAAAQVSRFADQVEDILNGSTDPAEIRLLVRAWSRVGRRRRRFADQAQQWRVLFDAIGDGVCFLDRQGTILRCNAALAEMLGATMDQLLGTDFRTRTPFLETLGSNRPLVRALQTGQRESIEHAVNGRWLRIVADPVLDHNEILGVIERLTDITEEVTLRRQVAEAESETRAQAERIQQLERDVRVEQQLVEIDTDASFAPEFTLSMRLRAPEEFHLAVQVYRNVLEQRLKQRGYRLEPNDAPTIRVLGDRLGELNASPRDVVEIHSLALRYQCAGATARKAQVYTEEGRLVILELMGRLVRSYRDRLAVKANASQTEKSNW